jgi:hypothetical protein
MKLETRLLNMILRGQADKFKTVLQEELNDRASGILEELYRLESQKLLESTQKINPIKQSLTTFPPVKKPEFMPESTYTLKDGNIGILTTPERHMISKLYENLNNDSKERMVKLLSESQESFNKIIKLAKAQSKR